MIGGFELPTGGRVELRGRDVTYDPPYKRPVNMVFQNYALFPHLDVAGNIGFGLKRKRRREGRDRPPADEALELVDLAGYGKRKPNQLSGGQQQRVALARALVNRPNVLLLDEPLGALDLKLRKRMQIELKRIQTEVGITFVYVTHDQEEALTMATDRRHEPRQGGAAGRPEELYERPATLRGRLHRHDEPPPRRRLPRPAACAVDGGGEVMRLPERLPAQGERVSVGVQAREDQARRRHKHRSRA